MEITFKTGTTATLVEVERDDEQFVIGRTDSGKRLVVPRSSLVERAEGEAPIRHPFRVYLIDGGMIRVVDPAFEEVEQFFLSAPDDDVIQIRTEDSFLYPLQRGRMLSILSAMPEDEARTSGAANGAQKEPVAG